MMAGNEKITSAWISIYSFSKQGYHSFFLVLKSDGSLHSVGWNGYGQLGISSKVSSSSLVPLSGFNECAKIAKGQEVSYCIKKEGSLWSWGRGLYGESGLGDNNDRTAPTQVGISQMWSDITSYGSTAYGLNNETLYAWGYNSHGELGDGTTVNKNTPTFISNSYTKAYAGLYHAILQDSISSLYATGYGAWGSLGDGTTVSKSTPFALNIQRDKVFTGLGFNFVIHNDALYGWGANFGGEQGTGATGYVTVPTKISY